MRAAALACGALAAPVAAAGSGFEGVWCGARDTVFIDETGLGFNDHVLCDWRTPPGPDAGAWRTTLACRAVHLFDGAPVALAPVVLHIEARLVDAAHLRLRRERDGGMTDFARCG